MKILSDEISTTVAAALVANKAEGLLIVDGLHELNASGDVAGIKLDGDHGVFVRPDDECGDGTFYWQIKAVTSDTETRIRGIVFDGNGDSQTDTGDLSHNQCIAAGDTAKTGIRLSVQDVACINSPGDGVQTYIGCDATLIRLRCENSGRNGVSLTGDGVYVVHKYRSTSDRIDCENTQTTPSFVTLLDCCAPGLHGKVGADGSLTVRDCVIFTNDLSLSMYGARLEMAGCSLVGGETHLPGLGSVGAGGLPASSAPTSSPIDAMSCSIR